MPDEIEVVPEQPRVTLIAQALLSRPDGEDIQPEQVFDAPSDRAAILVEIGAARYMGEPKVEVVEKISLSLESDVVIPEVKPEEIKPPKRKRHEDNPALDAEG